MSRRDTRHLGPTAADVEDVLGRLLERPVVVSPSPVFNARDNVVCAVYRDDDARLAAMVVADLAFALYAGAALALVPPAIPAELIVQGATHEGLMDNYAEVANVAARWFNGVRQPHVVLASVHGAAEATPAGTMVFRFAPPARRDYTVALGGYGDGRLSVLMS